MNDASASGAGGADASVPFDASLASVETGRLFQRLARQFSDRVLAEMRGRGYEGLTLFHTQLVANLDPSGNRVTELAARAGMTKQAMGQLAKELEASGYVRREPDPHDNRASIVRFTERGERLLADSYAAKAAAEEQYRAVLGDADLARLRTMLARIVGKA